VNENDSDDYVVDDHPHRLPEAQKRLRLATEIMGSVKKFYPRTYDCNRADLVLDILRDGTIYGADGIAAMRDTHVSFGKERFKA
jgi:hypothetical protein